ncbi:MAG TPA: hypothetical protein VGU65_11820 [Frateuria sp.]|uniref:hypothetical protein n=1 Tax=Frateuria sp. TaxID=2211372 RepID=UPI002DEDFAC7|nr:hypothetical protein [Frateuria sp.]
MRFLRWIVLLSLAVALIACGPPRKSVFPPTLSIQQLSLTPGGAWRLTVRIQNNSYGGMDFTELDGQLAMADSVPVRVHGSFDRDIPAFAGDVVQIDVLPTAAMSKALAASAAKGSAGALSYTLSGSVRAKPEQEKAARDFDFSGKDWLSPVPGIAHTWR